MTTRSSLAIIPKSSSPRYTWRCRSICLAKPAGWRGSTDGGRFISLLCKRRSDHRAHIVRQRTPAQGEDGKGITKPAACQPYEIGALVPGLHIIALIMDSDTDGHRAR